MRRSKKIILSLLFLPLIISSCISIKELKRKNTSGISVFSPTNLAGTYSNHELNSSYHIWGLFACLRESYSGKFKTQPPPDSACVKLELLNDHQLNVKLLNNNKELLDEFNLSGTIEDNYFSIDRKLFLLPIPLLFLHFETKSLIGNTNNGNLIVLHGSANQGWILILAGGDEIITQSQFEKCRN